MKEEREPQGVEEQAFCHPLLRRLKLSGHPCGGQRAFAAHRLFEKWAKCRISEKGLGPMHHDKGVVGTKGNVQWPDDLKQHLHSPAVHLNLDPLF